MRVLAIDASTEWCSVAAGDARGFAQREEHVGPAHSERVLPMAHAALAELGWRLADLDAIAFGAGPGSFTGVRIACGVAQGLGFGLERPLLPVGTLEAIAHEVARDDHGATHVLACLDARMREIYLAAFERAQVAWHVLAAPAVLPPDEAALPDAQGPWIGAGNGFAAYPSLAPRLAIADVRADVRPTARAIGELALPRLDAGQGVPAHEALPLYVRHRVALTAAERAAGARL